MLAVIPPLATIAVIAPPAADVLRGEWEIEASARRTTAIRSADPKVTGDSLPEGQSPKLASGPTRCDRVVRPLAAGAIASAADLAPADCTTRPPTAFRYDGAAHAARALRPIAAGGLVPTLPDFALPAVIPGEALVVSARVGRVRLTRSVRALQAALPGQRLFVRSDDNRIFVVTLRASEP